MANEQIEYCGKCEHYAECIERLKEGRLQSCRAAKEEK